MYQKVNIGLFSLLITRMFFSVEFLANDIKINTPCCWNLMLCMRRQEAWIISLLQNIIADSIIKEGLLGPKLILFMTIYPYYVYKIKQCVQGLVLLNKDQREERIQWVVWINSVKYIPLCTTMLVTFLLRFTGYHFKAKLPFSLSPFFTIMIMYYALSNIIKLN